MERLRFANEREEKATSFLSGNAVEVTSATSDRAGVLVLEGTVQDKGKNLNPSLTIDPDNRIIGKSLLAVQLVNLTLQTGRCG